MKKLLRNSIALVKEMMEQAEVQNVAWMDTKKIIADILTKKGGNASWMKSVIEQNKL